MSVFAKIKIKLISVHGDSGCSQRHCWYFLHLPNVFSCSLYVDCAEYSAETSSDPYAYNALHKAVSFVLLLTVWHQYVWAVSLWNIPVSSVRSVAIFTAAHKIIYILPWKNLFWEKWISLNFAIHFCLHLQIYLLFACVKHVTAMVIINRIAT